MLSPSDLGQQDFQKAVMRVLPTGCARHAGGTLMWV